MSRNPWIKFYPADWRADPALRNCSLAARGLWLEMLCIMHEATPYGTLVIKGKPVTEQQLAAQTGGSPEEVKALLAELEGESVFSLDGKVIFSRRMQRDREKAERVGAIGKQGGNPSIRRGAVPKELRVRRFRRSDAPAKALRIFQRCGGACHWCRKELDPENYHIGYIVPVRDGGTNDESNIVVTCSGCDGRHRDTPTLRADSDPNPPADSDPNPPVPHRRICADSDPNLPTDFSVRTDGEKTLSNKNNNLENSDLNRRPASDLNRRLHSDLNRRPRPEARVQSLEREKKESKSSEASLRGLEASPEANLFEDQAAPAVVLKTGPPQCAQPSPKKEGLDPRADLFRLGKEVFGREGGGLINKLLKLNYENVSQTRMMIERSAKAGDPKSYIGAIFRNLEQGRDWRGYPAGSSII